MQWIFLLVDMHISSPLFLFPRAHQFISVKDSSAHHHHDHLSGGGVAIALAKSMHGDRLDLANDEKEEE